MKAKEAANTATDTPPAALGRERPLPLIIGFFAVALAFVWSYSSVLVDLWEVWRDNDNFSAGLLVPILAVYMIVSQKKELAAIPVRPSLWGLAVVALGFALRFVGTLLYFASVERFSIIVVLVGLTMALGGTRLAFRLKWTFAFLLLMLPWPNRVYARVSLPLQSLATKSAVFMLETLGWVVQKQGNIIQIGDTRLFVAEACSGLRMLTAFMIVGALVAFLCRRPPWQKVILMVSTVLIAVLCNTIRLTVTSIAYAQSYGESVNKFFHDFGGIAMMPLALLFLKGELVFFKRLVTTVPADPRKGAAGGIEPRGKEGA